MATVTAYKALDALGHPIDPGTVAYEAVDPDVKAADHATDYTVLGSHTLSISSETARGIPHPGIVAHSSQRWANRLCGVNGQVAELTFDNATDLVETIDEGPDTGTLNASYRLSACDVVSVSPHQDEI